MTSFARRAFLIIVILCLGAAAQPAQAQPADIPVGVQLALLIDISGSVDATEYGQQMQGYENAFNDPIIQGLVANTAGGVGIAAFLFSTTTTSSALASWSAPILNWRILDSAADAGQFATEIGAFTRPSANPSDPEGDTNIANGIQTAAGSIMGNGYESDLMIIDVSTDGIQNVELDGTEGDCGPPLTEFQQVCFDVVEDERDLAGFMGITINAIGIETETTPGLLTGYLADHVIIGDNAFVASALDFDAFSGAIIEKLTTELSAAPVIPVPAAVYLFGSALLGLGGLARRRKTN